MAEQKVDKQSVKNDGFVHVVARLEVTSQENLEKFLTILSPVVDKTNKEKGCIRYNIHQDKKNPLLYMMIEKWENQQLLDSHLASAHITPLFGDEFAKICKVQVSFCREEQYKSPKQSLVGQKIPAQDVFIYGDDDEATKVSTDKLFLDKKVIICGIPGAFTKTCQNKHVPSYIEKYDDLKKIADDVYILSVNDALVLNAFNKSIGGQGKLGIISDFDASLCKKLGLTIDASSAGLGIRASRFSCYVINGVIEQLFVETDPGKMTNTDAGTLLNAIGLWDSLSK